MKPSNRPKTSLTQQITRYVRAHKVSLGVFLAAYGAFYLSTVVMGGWTLATWGKDLIPFPTFINPLLLRSLINPIFFLTSLPTLIAGAIMLSVYSIRGLGNVAVDDKEHIAILLTAFGFTYLVIGAWPLQNPVDFPWQWQKQIVSYGPIFAWLLYLLGLLTVLVGGVSLYMHSRIYHQNHP